MFQRLKDYLGPITIAVAGALGSVPAHAGCMDFGGTLFCADWITGSEVQLGLAKGIGNIKDDCSDGQCPTVTGSVIGTNGTGLGKTLEELIALYQQCKTGECDTVGILYCINHGGNASKAQGQPFYLTGTLTGTDPISSGDCAKNGKCTTQVTLEGIANATCINPNWDPLTFTASEFFGYSRFDWKDNKLVPHFIEFVDFCSATLPGQPKAGQSYVCQQIYQLSQ